MKLYEAPHNSNIRVVSASKVPPPMSDLIERLRKRAEIRRQIQSRKSVQEGKPDRLADLLEEAANALEKPTDHYVAFQHDKYIDTSEYDSGMAYDE